MYLIKDFAKIKFLSENKYGDKFNDYYTKYKQFENLLRFASYETLQENSSNEQSNDERERKLLI